MSMDEWARFMTKDQILAAYYPGGLPNKAAAIAAAVLFGAATLGVVGTTIKTRAWWMLVCVVTGALEVAGYALRVQMLAKPDYYTYVVSYAFLVIGPVFLVIIEYICVSKLIARVVVGRKSRFARAVAWFMTVSEIICLSIQCASSGPLTSKDEQRRELGGHIMLAGLSMQVAFFTIFTAITIYVNRSAVYGYRGNKQFKLLFATLYATIALFYIRNIFRIIEFAQGFFGYLATHEEFFYVFDFVPMFSILALFAVLNYGFWLGPVAKVDRVQQNSKEDTESPRVVEMPAVQADKDSADLVVVASG